MTFQYFDSASAAVKKHVWRQNSNRRKIEIQILRETATGNGKNHIRTCAQKLSSYFCNLIIFSPKGTFLGANRSLGGAQWSI